MDAASYQNQAREAAQLIHAEAMVRMMEAVSQPKCDPELAVKVFNATTAVAQAVPKDKDPLANLPVFNITFVNGRMTAEALPGLEQVEVLTSFNPSAAMLSMARINADIEDVESIEAAA